MDLPIAVVPLLDLNNLCRACFKELNATKTAEASVNMLEMPGLLNKLSACISNMFITTNRGSKYLCVACVERVNEFYEFREMCLQSIRRFEETQYNEESIKSEETNEISFSSESVIKEEYELHNQALTSNRETTSIILPESAKDLPEIFVDSEEYFITETNSIQKLNQQDTSVNEKVNFHSEQHTKSIKSGRALGSLEYNPISLAHSEQDLNAKNETVFTEDDKEFVINTTALNEEQNTKSFKRERSIEALEYDPTSLAGSEHNLNGKNEPVFDEDDKEFIINTTALNEEENTKSIKKERATEALEYDPMPSAGLKYDLNAKNEAVFDEDDKEFIINTSALNEEQNTKSIKRKRSTEALEYDPMSLAGSEHDLNAKNEPIFDEDDKEFIINTTALNENIVSQHQYNSVQMSVDNLGTDVSVRNEPISNEGEVEFNSDASSSTSSSPNIHNDFQEDASEHGIRSNVEVANSAGGKLYIYYCDQCPRHFRTEHNFNAHMQTHKGLKPYPCTHEGCDKSFLCLKTLKNHENRHDSLNGEYGLKRYYCTYEGCDKSFTWPELLEKHRLKHENNEFGLKRYHCTHEGCNASFCRADTLKMHQSRHEDPSFKYAPKPYPCTYEGCDKSFAGLRGLRRHRISHEAQIAPKRYPCTHAGCNKTFAWAQSLKKHQTIHGDSIGEYDPKPYPCPHEGCNESFWELLGLNRHRRKHKDPNSEYRYYCQQPNCTRGFQSYTGLQTHMLRHAGIKKYECPRCNIRKTTKKELTVHMEKPCPKYPCRFCKEVFKSWDDMTTHRRTIHPSTCLKCRHCPQILYSTAARRRHESKKHPTQIDESHSNSTSVILEDQPRP